MTFEVYLNNVKLKDTPIGLNELEFNFERSSSLYGITVISSLDLTFVGDGYCILRDFAEYAKNCNIPCIINTICSGKTTTILTGVIELGSIKIDYSNKKALTVVSDNSPLALISYNAEIDFDFNSTKDLFGNAQFTPTYDVNDMFVDNGTYPVDNEDTPMVSLSTAIQKLVRFMTGATSVTFTSDFFTSEGAFENWRIQFSSPPSGGTQSTNVKFTNFSGQDYEVTISTPFVGPGHIGTISEFLASPGGYLDFNGKFFNYAVFDTDTIDLYASTPWQSLEVTGTPVGATVTLVSDLIDSVFNIYFLNYKMLKKVDNNITPYNFKLSFKYLMTELNKLTNCLFFVSYNPSNQNSILFRIEDENYFLSQTPNIIIDEVKNLEADFIEENIYSRITTGSKQNVGSSINEETNLTSLFCGKNTDFDAKTDLVIDHYQIVADLVKVYDPEDVKEDIYVVQVNSADTQAKQFDLGTTVLGYKKIYNGQLYNNTTVYRHLSKFKGDLSGSPDKNVINNYPYKMFTVYKFEYNIPYYEFINHIQNSDKRILFKTKEMTEYFTGLVTKINYNFITGVSQFTVLGK